jgi:hypothetical protein
MHGPPASRRAGCSTSRARAGRLRTRFGPPRISFTVHDALCIENITWPQKLFLGARVPRISVLTERNAIGVVLLVEPLARALDAAGGEGGAPSALSQRPETVNVARKI